MAGKINEALKYCVRVPTDGEEPVNATELSVVRQFRDVSTSRAGCPDDPPNWLLIADVFRGTQRRFPAKYIESFFRLSRILLDL